MRKVIQIQTVTVGDNVNAEEKLITTILYDNGDIYEGCNEVISSQQCPLGTGTINVKREMVWRKLELPKAT